MKLGKNMKHALGFAAHTRKSNFSNTDKPTLNALDKLFEHGLVSFGSGSGVGSHGESGKPRYFKVTEKGLHVAKEKGLA